MSEFQTDGTEMEKARDAKSELTDGFMMILFTYVTCAKLCDFLYRFLLLTFYSTLVSEIQNIDMFRDV